MGTILAYPKSLLRFLEQFTSCFSKPQFSNFLQMTNGIALSSYAAISRIGQMFEPGDPSAVNKFLTQSPWEEEKVKENLHTMMFKHIPDVTTFIGDDTLSEKPFARCMDGANKHYSGMHKKHVNGHALVTCGFYHQDGFIPFDVQLYLKKQDAQKLHRQFATKNEIMCEKIDTVSIIHKPYLMLFDSWYANTTIFKKLKEHEIHFITQLKSNRNVTMHRRKRQIINHAKDIPIADYNVTTIDQRLFRYYETDGFISGVGTIKIIYTQMYLNDDKQWSDLHFIITDMLFLSAEQTIQLYLQRFSIEVFHREAKQQLGLDAYQLTSIRGIERYLFLVMLVYVMLMVLSRLLAMKSQGHTSIGKLRELLKEECYTTLLKKARIQNVYERSIIAKRLSYVF